MSTTDRTTDHLARAKHEVHNGYPQASAARALIDIAESLRDIVRELHIANVGNGFDS